MKISLIATSLIFSAAAVTGYAQAAEDTDQCSQQAQTMLTRLQAEVVGDLSSAQRAAASQIILDVCAGRELEIEEEKITAVEEAVEEAVEQTREEEQEKSSGWFTNSGNKPGNDRLRRKNP